MSMSFYILLFHIPQASFLSIYATNSNIITLHLNFWDTFLINLAAFSHSSFQFIVNSWINPPNLPTPVSTGKKISLNLMFYRRDFASYLNNSLINFTLKEL